MSEQNIVSPLNNTGKSYSVMGNRYVVKASGEDTGGIYSLFDVHLPRGGGTPSHIHHNYEQSYWIIFGEVTFVIGEKQERIAAKAGDYIRIPKGQVAHFKNEIEHHAQMVCMSMPSGIEKFYAEVGLPLPETTSNPILAKVEDVNLLLALAPKYGMEIIIPETQPVLV